jgi:hypothetical protein
MIVLDALQEILRIVLLQSRVWPKGFHFVKIINEEGLSLFYMGYIKQIVVLILTAVSFVL